MKNFGIVFALLITVNIQTMEPKYSRNDRQLRHLSQYRTSAKTLSPKALAAMAAQQEANKREFKIGMCMWFCLYIGVGTVCACAYETVPKAVNKYLFNATK